MIKSKIKICGIKNLQNLKCCIKNKVDFFGLIFYEKSPRNISLEKASFLIDFSKNKKISSVGVFVNKKLGDLIRLLKNINFDLIQLHGVENDQYIVSLKKNKKIKIIKVISIKSARDFNQTKKYPNADYFLFDYKPLKEELPGGNAKKFDWSLLKNNKIKKPWFISGGINITNINDIKNYAIPYGIDVSSGVEEDYGIKSNKKITSLIISYDSK